MEKKPGKFLWLRIIGYMLIPLLLSPIFFYSTYPLKPHCSLGQGPYGCTPLCEATSYFEDGRPSSYKETPCFHQENPNKLQKFTYQKSGTFYSILLVSMAGVVLWLSKVKKLKILAKVALAPIYFWRENRQNKNLFVRLLNLALIFVLTIEWVAGYVVVIGGLVNKINLF